MCCGNSGQVSRYTSASTPTKKKQAKVVQMEVTDILRETTNSRAMSQNAAANRQYMTTSNQRKIVHR